MSDNLKTWPDEIILVPKTEYNFLQEDLPAYQPIAELTLDNLFEHAKQALWAVPQYHFEGDWVTYIRADIAKEREKKLIQAAFHLGRISNFNRQLIPGIFVLADEPSIYEAAELDELK